MYSTVNAANRCFLLFLMAFITLLMTGCGKELSRSDAEKMIRESLDKKQQFLTLELGNDRGIDRFTYPGEGHYRDGHQKNALGDGFVSDRRKLLAMTEKGLLTYKQVVLFGNDGAERIAGDPHRFYFDEYMLELTEKAKAYVAKEEIRPGGRRNTKVVTVLLANIDKIEVSGITKPAEGQGQKMSIANYTVNYKATPFGEIFVNDMRLEKKGEAPFVLYDDGWRLAR